MNRTDAVSGLVVTGLGALFVGLSAGLPDAIGQSYGPGLVPTLIGAGLLVSGAWLTARALLLKHSGGQSGNYSRSGWIASTAIIGALLAYVLLADRLGFHLTALFCITPIMWLFTKKLGLSILITVIGIACIHFTFYNMLRVPLPWGILLPYAW